MKPSSPPPRPDSPRLLHVGTDVDFDHAVPVIAQLRPHLTPATFRERVRKQMTQGYRLLDHLWVGRAMYVDDLVSDEALRSHGYGEKLFSWLREIAVADGCIELHLDSGVHRTRAHKFYFRQGMHIGDFDFVEKLTPAS